MSGRWASHETEIERASVGYSGMSEGGDRECTLGDDSGCKMPLQLV